MAVGLVEHGLVGLEHLLRAAFHAVLLIQVDICAGYEYICFVCRMLTLLMAWILRVRLCEMHGTLVLYLFAVDVLYHAPMQT